MMEAQKQNLDVTYVINKSTVSDRDARHMRSPVRRINMVFFEAYVIVSKANEFASQLRRYFDVEELKGKVSFTHTDLSNTKKITPNQALMLMAIASVAGIIRLETLISRHQILVQHGGFRAYFNDLQRKERD